MHTQTNAMEEFEFKYLPAAADAIQSTTQSRAINYHLYDIMVTFGKIFRILLCFLFCFFASES